MIFRIAISLPKIALALVVFTASVFAGTIQTLGPGSAVAVIDRSTTFDNLNFAGRGTPLSDYQSGGLYVRTNGNSYYGDDERGKILVVGTPFNPFHLSIAPDHSYFDVGGGFYFPYDADPGNYDWVTIQTTDGRKIYGVEFLYGNGWTTGDIWGAYPWGNNSAYLDWKTLIGGTVVSSGQVGISVGSVVGFKDLSGFDQLMVRAPHPNAANPSFQELAIDDLKVALSSGGTVPSSVLFLNNSRFKVEVNWSIPTGTSGQGTAIPLTSDSGYFWFFSDSNIELLVKVLDGRGVNGHFWVFYGALTDVQYAITITDTQTGAVKVYYGQQGVQKSANDINAFADAGHVAVNAAALDRMR